MFGRKNETWSSFSDMAESRSATLLVVSVGFMILAFDDGVGTKNEATRAPEISTKCTADGSSCGKGMSISWGSKKAIRECGPTRPKMGEGHTYAYKFSEAFSVSYSTKCDCEIEGKPIVSFKPINLKQARVCAGKEEQTDPMEMKRQCWEAYKRGRGMKFHVAGDMKVLEYNVPWMDGNLVVSRGDKCQGEACNSITLPGVTDDMSREDKRIIGNAIKKIMDGQKDDVPRSLVELIEILPANALDDAEFQEIDADGDGTLTLDELSDFYPQFDRDVMDKFIKEVDDNSNGTVDPEEFQDLKKKMRDYDPTVNLINGTVVDYVLSPASGEVKETKAKWKTATVVCMKGNMPAPGECEGSEEQAIEEFNMNC